MTRIEPLRRMSARRRAARQRRGGPNPLVDVVFVAAIVVALVAFRRRLGRLATERTGTWVGTIR